MQHLLTFSLLLATSSQQRYLKHTPYFVGWVSWWRFCHLVQISDHSNLRQGLEWPNSPTGGLSQSWVFNCLQTSMFHQPVNTRYLLCVECTYSIHRRHSYSNPLALLHTVHKGCMMVIADQTITWRPCSTDVCHLTAGSTSSDWHQSCSCCIKIARHVMLSNRTCSCNMVAVQTDQ